MATLQNIRSKGPLLIVVIGLALFAFIAGDAWKILQPQQSQDVGEVNGKTLSAQAYQAMVEEYTEIIKMSNNLSNLTEEQSNQIKDEIWRSYVNEQLIEAEAEKIGLTVTKAEVEAVIKAGVHPMLQNSPFRNPQTGAFDQDMLKMFLVEYAKMDETNMHPYYQSMYKFWNFIEKSIQKELLAEKYNTLITQSISSNTIEARSAFDGRVNSVDVELVAIPYSAIPDSTIKVKMSEVKALYSKKKELFRQQSEARNIKYIDVQVTASEEDINELRSETTEAVSQLEEASSDYASLVRSLGTEFAYTDLYYRKEGFPADVIARLDSVGVGEVYGPYFNAGDNTYNAFKKISKATMADSVEYRQIQVYYDQDIVRNRELADSIYNALKGGANFEEIAELYGQPGAKNWISSASYERATTLDNDNLKYISTITSLNVNEMENVQIGAGNVIIQVTNKKKMVDKYKLAIVKRTVNFSTETYNKAYNDFSQFIASNTTMDQLNANTEDAGYRLLETPELLSSAGAIGNIKGSKEALRWVFAAKPGEVSGLFECGDNDRLLVVGLNEVIKEGYRPLEKVQNQLREEIVKEKKAEMILANMKGATTLEQYKALEGAKSDTIKHVTFAAPAFISSLYNNEPVVSGIAATTAVNQVSAPVVGNSAVFVVKPYSKETLSEEYDAEKEKKNAEMMNSRMMQGFMSDLYLKANVKDNRYLFF